MFINYFLYFIVTEYKLVMIFLPQLVNAYSITYGHASAYQPPYEKKMKKIFSDLKSEKWGAR